MSQTRHGCRRLLDARAALHVKLFKFAGLAIQAILHNWPLSHTVNLNVAVLVTLLRTVITAVRLDPHRAIAVLRMECRQSLATHIGTRFLGTSTHGIILRAEVQFVVVNWAVLNVKSSRVLHSFKIRWNQWRSVHKRLEHLSPSGPGIGLVFHWQFISFSLWYRLVAGSLLRDCVR